VHKKPGAAVAQAVHVIVGSFHDVEGRLQRDGFALGFVVSDSEGKDIDHHLSKMKEYGGYTVIAQSRSLLVIVNRSARVVVVEVEQMDVRDNLLGRKWAKHIGLIPAGHSPGTDVW
jgi:hypothetical protein